MPHQVRSIIKEIDKTEIGNMIDFGERSSAR